MRSPASRLRISALVAAAALALHELRSEAEIGSHAHPELAERAHGYLGTLTLVVGGLVAVAFAHLLARLITVWRSPATERQAPHDAARLWRLVSIGLLGICLGQELVESVIATGHGIDLGALLEHGGWTSVPLAIVFGGGVVAAARGSEIAIELVARRTGPTLLAARRDLHLAEPRPGHSPVPAPLADMVAGRAPPPLPAAAH